MTDHLSEDQLAQAVVGRAASHELQHVNECPQCRAQLFRFRDTVSQFQHAIQERVDGRIALGPANVLRPALSEIGVSKVRWILTAVTVAAVALIAIVTSDNKPQEHVGTMPPDPQAIMDRVNLHLSRAVPTPMEPLLFVVPPAESESEAVGGVQ